MVTTTQTPPPSKVSSPEQKFLTDLGRLYDAKCCFVEASQQVQQQISNQQLKSAIQMDIGNNNHQIQNLEQIFQTLGQQPQRIKCESAAALVSEGQKMVQEVGDNPMLRDATIAVGQAAVKNAESSNYIAMITAAGQKGQKEIVALLQQNLLQNQQAIPSFGLCHLELMKQMASQSSK